MRARRRDAMTIERALPLFADKPDECWNWPGSKDRRGRGIVYHEGKARKAHRIAYEQLVGPIPEGLEPDHLCRNLACFNPRHLEPVTHLVNSLRGEGLPAKNARKSHCDHGHPLSGANLRVYQRTWKSGKITEMRVCRQCVLEDTWRRRGKLPPRERKSA